MKIQIRKISKKLKNLREQKKLTQEELAKHLGVSRQSIIALEQGRCLPSLALAINFSEIFDLPFEKIFCQVESLHLSDDLSPWTPMHEASQLHESIDRLFTANTENLIQEKNSNQPLVNVYEKGDSIIVEADVPGVIEEDLAVEVGDDTITITGERKSESGILLDDYFRQEAVFGEFTRVITLPAIIDKDKTSAELKDGQLVICLPKKADITPKVIKVKVKKV